MKTTDQRGSTYTVEEAARQIALHLALVPEKHWDAVRCRALALARAYQHGTHSEIEDAYKNV